jgi:RHS repeat-associated protein
LTANGSYTINRNINLPNVTPGNYYIFFHADAYNYQGETDNNNNYSQAIAITIGAPDLIVSNATAPESGALGEAVSLSWTVQNQGTVEAPADWTDYIYWSSNDTFDGSDILITSFAAAAQTPVAAGGSYSNNQSITLPNQVTFVGNGYLIVRADGNNVQGETNEINNDRAIPIRIDAPDLIVSNATAPASVTVGATIGVTWEVKNQGSVAANADWYDRVVISTDQVFGNSDDTYLTEVWQGSFTPLAAAATYSRSLNVTLPNTATGDRYLLFKADNYNYQGETDETNNVYSFPINISASDLQVTATNAPSTAILGETVELTWTVANNGTGAASQDWYDRIYLSNNLTLDSGDVQVTSEFIGSQTPLAAGSSYTISKNIILPSFTPGNQYLLFVADRDNYQGEISENNNLAAVAISLTAPDLIVSNASVPATGTVGKSIEVSWTVQNQGTSAAPTDWYDRIYLSNDAVFDANADTYITQDLISTQTPLAAGASYTTTRNINLPNFATGSRYLIFVADGSGSQGETNESNNIRAAAINLNAPDLIVTDITAPVESLTGQPIEINWTVKNQGATTAEGTWYDYVSLVNTATNSTQYVGVFEYSGSLAAGASLNRTQSYSVPLGLIGNYRVVVTTDYYGQIAEGTQNESNNTTTDDRSISLQLAPVPNLQVTGVTAPSTAFSSQETVVQWTVKNVGTGATNAPVWYDHVYLSLDTTYDNTDTYLGYAVNPSYLNPDDSYSNSLIVTLPRGIDGNYYFLVQADAYNYVAEVGNEWDNWGSGGPTDVNLTPPPDLQVTAANAPNGAFSGQPMNLSWTVTNAGTGRTLETAWYDRVFMSADATLDADDRILGNFYHDGALNAGANYTGSATVNLPIGVAGNFFFFVQSDINNQVYEYFFENNNSGYDTTATNITLTPPPDLEFEYLTIPNNARSGNNLSISYRVTNFGATETPTYYWTDTLYLSSDNQLNTTTDINLGSAGQYGILYPGDGYDRTANFALPNTLTGTYYVFGVTDSGDQVFELNNVNNVTQSINQVHIVAQPADLVVTDAVIPTTGEAGKAISVQWTVKNQGTGDTIVDSWSDRLVASTDGVLGDADDLTLASFTRTGLLAPNGTYSRTESVILPFTLEGNYQLFVVTDSANSVYEGSNEGNNASSAFPLTITRDTPDLQVTSITLPNTVTPGQALSLNWTVANLGVGRTNSNYWYDQVYLSLDANVSSNDISLGSVYRAGALEPSASYAATGTFSLPVNLNGNYYVLVQADRDNNVIEGAFENNNVFASDSISGGGSGTGTIPITPAPSADLAVSAVDAPEQGIAGQSLSLTWTVVNNDANTVQSWYDAVYLSRDQVFDRNSDIYLGYRTHAGGLTAGDSYTATQSFNIPRGLGGRFYAFVVTDGGNAVYERLGEINNVSYDGFSAEIILPPPVDLVAGTVTVPVNGTPGQNATISYTVNNQSTNEAIGTWEDTIYLSSDKQWDVNDSFFGRVSQTGPVAGGGSYSKTVTATLPGVATGDYNVIVRSDIRNYIPESNEANNIKASLDDFAVDVESLELGTPDTGTLGQGQSVYYRVDVPAGETLLLSFDSQSTAAANELYIRYGDIPSRGQFDIGYSQPFSPDQEIIIPSTRGGTYYVLAYGDNVTSGAPSYSITADILEFSITDLGTNLGSNKGQTTIRISGAKFTPNDVVSLIREDGTQRQASRIWWKDSTELWATFDLQGLGAGAYDVKVNNATQTAILDEGFTVTNGAIGNLTVRVDAPSALRPGQAGVVTVNYANTGETDIVAPLLTLTADNANLRLPDQIESVGTSWQFLGISSEGPAGIIPPGKTGSLSLLFDPLVSNGNVAFSLSQALEDQLIDWSSLKDQAKPSNISDEAWEVIWQNLIASVGNQASSYQEVLAENATHLSLLDEYTSDAMRLLGFELLQVSNSLVGGSPRDSIDERFTIGTFARGGVNDWDIQAIPESNGDVTIFFGTSPRFFAIQSNGAYQGQFGDNSILTFEGGVYRLHEDDGKLIAFRLDGKLDYIEDANLNQITANYTDGRLSRLLHSDGNYLEFSYNADGLVNQTIDQDNRITFYEYDNSGEYLLSVTTPEGTTSYTYEVNSNTGSHHAIKSVRFSDNTGIYYEYDSQGRLVKQSLNGNAEYVTYSYDSSGGVVITNVSGSVSKLFYNDRGTLGRIEDPLKRISQYKYDNNGNLTKVTAADNTISTFTYDNLGNLVSSVNALGHQTKFTYETNYNQLASVLDPRGNVLTYTYDNRNNLQEVTYADGSKELFSYDARGSVTIAVNRLNQNISYTYSSDGLLTRKDFADGTSASFSYDSRGNLLSAIDSDSSVTYTYDSSNRITRVNYNTERFLEFTYDSSGRRSRMVDQDGFTTNYSYDSLGRLKSLADATGANIITYSYDNVGRLGREDNGNGTFTTYSYDLAGQLVELVNYKSDATVNSYYYYAYDNTGRRISMTTLDGVTTYGYDPIGQLTLVNLPNGRIIEYQYDAAGNRTKVRDSGIDIDYSTNILDQYTRLGDATYAYDADGNLISKSVDSNTWTYTYDSEHRLIASVTPEGNWSYEYDALGNRIASNFNGHRTEYLLDPKGLGDVVAEYGGDGNIVARYTHGLGLVSRVDGLNAASYYDSDANGSIVGLSDIAGDYLNLYRYLPFGESLSTSETVSNPFEYVGQWGVMREGNTLDFMRARFYDPLTGKFTSPDPLGINAGDTNLYRYVSNNPNNYTDPSGHLLFLAPAVWWAIGLGAAAGAGTDAAIQAVSIGAGVQDDFSVGSVIFSGVLGGASGGYLAHLKNVKRGINIGTHPKTQEALYKFIDFSHTIPDRVGKNRPWLHWLTDKDHWLGIGKLNGQYVSRATHAASDPEAYKRVLKGLKPFIHQKYGLEKWWIRTPDWFKGSIGGGLLGRLGGATTSIVRPSDPNDIVGPAGFGDENWIASQTLPYTIRFENQASATAPAQTVTITHPLDSDLDLRTFRLGSFGWSGLTFNVPDNRSFYNQRVDLTEELGFLVDVFAGIDIQKGEAFWTLTTIDPETGETPDNPLIGFLPPNNEDGVGDGFVTYSIRPGRTAETGDVIDAVATIIFDTEEPISTPPIFNTLDVDKPSSEVNALPATTATPELLVSWSGADVGAALASYTVYVSDNGGPYLPWLQDTTLTESNYAGSPGHLYRFIVVAKDNAGNIQVLPQEAQATTFVQGEVNQPPSAVALTNVTATLSENTSTTSRIKVADISISDDALGSNTIALSGADAAAFEVEGTVLYLKAGTSLDYETKAAYAVTVSVSDAALSGSSPVSTGYSLSITDVNEAPTALSLNNVTASLAENTSTASRIKVADIAVSDDALGSNTIALSGADAAAFEVEGTVLYLKAGTSLDYETKAAYAVTVSVSDPALSGSSPVSTGYSLSITDVNEAPTAVALTNVTPSLSENSSTTSRIKVADIAISDDALGSNTIALSGADAAAFEMDGTAFFLKAGTSLNFETKTSYDVIVSVSDATISGSSPISTSYNLAVTDVNEAPTAVELSATTFDENIPDGSLVASLSSSDPDTSPQIFSYGLVAGAGDTDNLAFFITGNELHLTHTPDFESQSSYSIRLKTTDQGGLSFERDVQLVVNDLPDSPSCSISNVTVSEASPFVVVAVNLSAATTAPISFTPSLAAGGSGVGFATIGNDSGAAIQWFDAATSTWSSAAAGVTIAAGSTTVLLRTSITNDSIYEGIETFEFRTGAISGPVSNASGASSTVSIADDGSSTNSFDAGTNSATPTSGTADNDLPSIGASAITVSEASPYAVVAFSLSTLSSLPVTFTPSLVSGTASIGTDTGSTIEWLNGATWESAVTGVTIPTGSSSVLVRTSLTNDNIYEGPETFQIGTGAVGGVSNTAGVSATVTIVDNGSSANTFTATSTSPFPTAGSADNDSLPIGTFAVAAISNGSETGPTPSVFRISRTGDASAALTFNYGLSGTAIRGSDFTLPASFNAATGLGTLSFDPGVSSIDLSIASLDDASVDGDRSINLGLTAPERYTLATASASVTIADNDVPLPTSPVITVVSTSAGEPDAGGTRVVPVTLSLSSSSSSSITVGYRTSTSGSTATAGSDYNAIGDSTLTFAPGTSSRTFNLTINGDNTVESNESITLEFFNPVGATFAGASSTANSSFTILDNDSSSNLSRDASAASAPVALYGNPFNDTLIGGGGNDIISGDLTGATTGGADRITGNVGSDTLTGGRGADHFLYPLFSDSTLNSLDTIVDFRATTDGDRIGLAALPSSLWSSGLITPSSPNLAAAVNQVFADKDAGSAGNQPLAAGEAVFFAFDAIPGNTLSRQWYSAVNDSNTSFSASDDLLIRLAGSQTFATGNLVVTTFFATI